MDGSLDVEVSKDVDIVVVSMDAVVLANVELEQIESEKAKTKDCSNPSDVLRALAMRMSITNLIFLTKTE